MPQGWCNIQKGTCISGSDLGALMAWNSGKTMSSEIVTNAYSAMAWLGHDITSVAKYFVAFSTDAAEVAKLGCPQKSAPFSERGLNRRIRNFYQSLELPGNYR